MSIFTQGDSLAITDTGSAVDFLSAPTKSVDTLLIVNDGPDDVFLHLDEETGVASSTFSLKTGEFLEVNNRAVKKFFLICASTETAAIRYYGYENRTLRGMIS